MSRIQWVNDLQSELENDDYLRDNKYGAAVGGAVTGVAGVLGVGALATTAGVVTAVELGGATVAAEAGVVAAGAAVVKGNVISEAVEMVGTLCAVPGAYIGATVEHGIRKIFG